MSIPISQWGRDHWSTLAYVETRCVDHYGALNKQQLRIDPDIHPALAHRGSFYKKYPTRLKSGEVGGHDDMSCIEDMEAAGLLRDVGTGLHPVIVLSDTGKLVCAAIRKHKINGGSFGNFDYEKALILPC